MKWVLFTFLFCACVELRCEFKLRHKIAAIFTDGEAIQLEDGSAWGIGYWMIQNITDRPIVNTRWREGDAIEFYTEWKGALKIWYYLTNLRTGETVNGWLLHGPYAQNTYSVKECDRNCSIVHLNNSTSWIANQTWYKFPPYHISDIVSGKVFLLKKRLEDSYYLIKAGSYAGEGLEVKHLDLIR